MAPHPARQHAEWIKDLVEQLKTRNRAGALKHRPRLLSLGLLPERRFRVALSGHAHLREPRRAALVAEALPPLRALGGGARVAEVTIGEEVRLYHENES
jgi:hypothetical protein